MGRGRGGVAAGIVVVMVVGIVVGASGSKIYFPPNLHEIRTNIAIKKCQDDPACVLPPHLATGTRCKGEAEVKQVIDEIKTKFLETRSAGGGGEGGEGGRGGVCNGMAGEVVWPATGECVALLTQGPCPLGQWVKLRKTTLEPICENQPCDVPESLGGGPGVLVGEECFPPSHLPPSPRCPQNQEWITNEHGELECDCPPGLVFYPGDEACYKAYSMGPCAPGWIIRVEDTVDGNAGEARCFLNICPNEGMVMMENDTCRHAQTTENAQCYEIDTAGPCAGDTRLTVDEVLAEPICLNTHSVFSNAVKRCARGTREDLRGRCRSTFDSILSSLPLFTSTRRAGTAAGVCPPDEYFAGGACIKIVSK